MRGEVRGSIERPARARCPLAVRSVLSAPLQRSDEPAVMETEEPPTPSNWQRKSVGEEKIPI